MHGGEKSDSVIIPRKSPNKTGRPVSEAMERRAEPEEDARSLQTRRLSQVIRRRAPIENRNGLGYPADADFLHGMGC